MYTNSTLLLSALIFHFRPPDGNRQLYVFEFNMNDKVMEVNRVVSEEEMASTTKAVLDAVAEEQQVLDTDRKYAVVLVELLMRRRNHGPLFSSSAVYIEWRETLQRTKWYKDNATKGENYADCCQRNGSGAACRETDAVADGCQEARATTNFSTVEIDQHSIEDRTLETEVSERLSEEYKGAVPVALARRICDEERKKSDERSTCTMETSPSELVDRGRWVKYNSTVPSSIYTDGVNPVRGFLNHVELWKHLMNEEETRRLFLVCYTLPGNRRPWIELVYAEPYSYFSRHDELETETAEKRWFCTQMKPFHEDLNKPIEDVRWRFECHRNLGMGGYQVFSDYWVTLYDHRKHSGAGMIDWAQWFDLVRRPAVRDNDFVFGPFEFVSKGENRIDRSVWIDALPKIIERGTTDGVLFWHGFSDNILRSCLDPRDFERVTSSGKTGKNRNKVPRHLGRHLTNQFLPRLGSPDGPEELHDIVAWDNQVIGKSVSVVRNDSRNNP